MVRVTRPDSDWTIIIPRIEQLNLCNEQLYICNEQLKMYNEQLNLCNSRPGVATSPQEHVSVASSVSR